ncbi:hypothetical protein EOM39_01750 [Candidatus Gracilibacteria bacterium]|nr:hypothetical protein [Candidatus Gracilibacteria bacterium]
MLFDLKEELINGIYENILIKIDSYVPKIIGALSILLIGLIISVIIYKFVMYLFRKFKIVNLIDKLESKMDLNLGDSVEEENDDKKVKIKKLKRKRITEKIKVDSITAKAFSYYVFIVFFRLSVVVIGISEVEKFLSDVLSYLPNLFIAVCVGFFGIRFADTVYDIVYYTLELTKHQTSKIIAMGSKVIILFFTIMVVLDQIKIVSVFIINTIFVGFIATLTIGVGIALGLGGKDVAREILEGFRK